MKKALIKVLLLAMTLVTLLTVIPLSANATSDNKTEIFSYLTKEMGLNSAAACGIMANIEKESNFKPTTIIRDSNGLPSGGLCMWNGSRLSRLKNYCNNKGLNYLSIKGQLSYLSYELKLSQYKHVFDYLKRVPNNASGAYDAAYYWCYYFEIPASRGTRSVQRGNAAVRTYWPTYGNKTINTPELSFSSKKTTFDLDSSLTLKWTSGGDNADTYKLYVAKKNAKTGKFDWDNAKIYTTKSLKQAIKTNSLGSGDYCAYVKAINSSTNASKSSSKVTFVIKCLTHEYTGEVITAPTLTTTGKEKLTCQVCKEVTTAKIAKLTAETFGNYPMTTPSAESRTNNALVLKWAEYKGVDGYYVYLRVDNKWKHIGTVEDATQFTVTGLEAGTKYKFAVRAFFKDGENVYKSAYSASYVTSTQTDMVDLVYIKSHEGAEVELKWTEAENADGYAVYVSTDCINFERKAVVKGGNVTETTINDFSLGRIYYFRIHPYVDLGDHKVYSPSSNIRAALVIK